MNQEQVDVTLNTGARMPRLGLGVWKISGDAETERVAREAIELGYRSIDTASLYGNERGVGAAVRGCGVPRERLFVTTKVWNDDIRAGRIEAAFDRSLKLLGLEYVDLYLLHWPIAGRLAVSWKAMEQLLKGGRAKAIGVSNYLVPHLEEVLAAGGAVPAVNQIELHPFLQGSKVLQENERHGIRTEAWSPLAQGGSLLQDPVLGVLARAHGKTVAQVVLRWDIQRGVVAIPKTTKRARLSENLAIFDFALTDAEMAAIAALDRNGRIGADPMNVGF
ncbi:MAG: aldo/keto reductase [bacterium]